MGLIPILASFILWSVSVISIWFDIWAYIISFVLFLIFIVTEIKMNIKVAYRFYQGPLMGLGLSFLPVIFIPLLAISKNTYDKLQ